MVKIISGILYALVILSIIFVERKNPQQAISWILIVTVIPYAGLILYFIFGNTVNIKFLRYLRFHRISNYKNVVDDYYAALNDVNDLCLQAGLSDVDRRVSAFNNRYNQAPLTTFERAQFLTSGKEHYDALFNDIKNARHDIHVEFFTIHDDIVGKAFVDELAKKRRMA